MTTTSTRGADAALLFVALMWGGSYLAAQVLTGVASPEVVLALRFVPSLVVLGVFALARRSRFGARTLKVGLVLGVLQAATLLLETHAVTLTSSTNAGVLVCLAVVIAPALDGLWSGLRLPGRYYLAVLAGVVGVVMILGPGGLTSPNLGDLLVLGAACTRAALMVCSGHLTRGADFDAVALNTVQTALNAVLFTALAGTALPGVVVSLDGRSWMVVAFISLGCTCAAFLLQLWAIHHTSPTRASLLMGTEPVWALLVGVLLAGDRPGVLGLLGAVVVIAATVWGRQIESRWRRGLETAVQA